MKKHIRRRKVTFKCMYRHMHNLKIKLPKEKVIELVMEANLMIAMGITPKDFQKSLSAWERVREPLDNRDLNFYGMHVV